MPQLAADTAAGPEAVRAIGIVIATALAAAAMLGRTSAGRAGADAGPADPVDLGDAAARDGARASAPGAGRGAAGRRGGRRAARGAVRPPPRVPPVGGAGGAAVP